MDQVYTHPKTYLWPAAIAIMAGVTYWKRDLLLNPETNFRGIMLATITNAVALTLLDKCTDPLINWGKTKFSPPEAEEEPPLMPQAHHQDAPNPAPGGGDPNNLPPSENPCRIAAKKKARAGRILKTTNQRLANLDEIHKKRRTEKRGAQTDAETERIRISGHVDLAEKELEKAITAASNKYTDLASEQNRLRNIRPQLVEKQLEMQRKEALCKIIEDGIAGLENQLTNAGSRFQQEEGALVKATELYQGYATAKGKKQAAIDQETAKLGLLKTSLQSLSTQKINLASEFGKAQEQVRLHEASASGQRNAWMRALGEEGLEAIRDEGGAVSGTKNGVRHMHLEDIEKATLRTQELKKQWETLSKKERQLKKALDKSGKKRLQAEQAVNKLASTIERKQENASTLEAEIDLMRRSLNAGNEQLNQIKDEKRAIESEVPEGAGNAVRDFESRITTLTTEREKREKDFIAQDLTLEEDGELSAQEVANRIKAGEGFDRSKYEHYIQHSSEVGKSGGWRIPFRRGDQWENEMKKLSHRKRLECCSHLILYTQESLEEARATARVDDIEERKGQIENLEREIARNESVLIGQETRLGTSQTIIISDERDLESKGGTHVSSQDDYSTKEREYQKCKQQMENAKSSYLLAKVTLGALNGTMQALHREEVSLQKLRGIISSISDNQANVAKKNEESRECEGRIGDLEASRNAKNNELESSQTNKVRAERAMGAIRRTAEGYQKEKDQKEIELILKQQVRDQVTADYQSLTRDQKLTESEIGILTDAYASLAADKSQKEIEFQGLSAELRDAEEKLRIATKAFEDLDDELERERQRLQETVNEAKEIWAEQQQAFEEANKARIDESLISEQQQLSLEEYGLFSEGVSAYRAEEELYRVLQDPDNSEVDFKKPKAQIALRTWIEKSIAHCEEYTLFLEREYYLNPNKESREALEISRLELCCLREQLLQHNLLIDYKEVGKNEDTKTKLNASIERERNCRLTIIQIQHRGYTKESYGDSEWAPLLYKDKKEKEEIEKDYSALSEEVEDVEQGKIDIESAVAHLRAMIARRKIDRNFNLFDNLIALPGKEIAKRDEARDKGFWGGFFGGGDRENPCIKELAKKATNGKADGGDSPYLLLTEYLPRLLKDDHDDTYKTLRGILLAEINLLQVLDGKPVGVDDQEEVAVYRRRKYLAKAKLAEAFKSHQQALKAIQKKEHPYVQKVIADLKEAQRLEAEKETLRQQEERLRQQEAEMQRRIDAERGKQIDVVKLTMEAAPDIAYSLHVITLFAAYYIGFIGSLFRPFGAKLVWSSAWKVCALTSLVHLQSSYVIDRNREI